jgi:hypothetical protein
MLDEPVPVAKQRPHGQERVVHASDRREIGKRRAQREPGRRVLDRHFGHHRRAQALAVVEQPLARHAGVLDEEPARRANVPDRP